MTQITGPQLLDSTYWGCYKMACQNETVLKLFFNTCLFLAEKRDSLLKLLPSKIAPNSVIYDIGGHIGLYSVALAKSVPGSTVYSFEPNSRSYEALLHIINATGLKERIIIKNIAISDINGTRTFFISSESARSSFREINATWAHNTIINTYTVNCNTIDYLVENGICRRPDVLKIDVEGHEYEVLVGARETIASESPQIFMEPHRGVEGLNKVIDFLTPFGYKYKKLGYPLWFYKDAK